VHRDLKPENFMFDREGGSHLRLIDFGFAKYTHGKALKEALGTLSYAAPEVLKGNYGKECDLWSIGVMLFVMLAGTMPFFGASPSETKQAIGRGGFRMKPEVWSNVSADAVDLVRNLLVVSPRKRFTALQALHHPFITRNNKGPQLSHSHVQVVDAFRKFGKSSEFHRAAMLMCAHTLTNDERRNLRDVFLDLDTDDSGTINVEELRSLTVGEQHMSEAEFREIFHAMDFNNDGEIHYVDFLAAISCLSINFDDQHLQDAFNRFDRDQDGYISKKELKQVLGQSGGMALKMIEEADRDGDGRISFQEFALLVRAAPHANTEAGNNEEDDDCEEWDEDEEEDPGGKCQECSIQ